MLLKVNETKFHKLITNSVSVIKPLKTQVAANLPLKLAAHVKPNL